MSLSLECVHVKSINEQDGYIDVRVWTVNDQRANDECVDGRL